MQLKTILDSLKKSLTEKFPTVQNIADHERFTAATKLPAFLTEITDLTPATPSGDDGTERFCSTVKFATFIIYPTDGDERENRIAARVLALRFAHVIKYKIQLPTVTQPSVTDIATDYLSASGDNAAGADNAALVEVQRVDWEVDGWTGESIWQDDAIGSLALDEGQPAPLSE